MEGTLCLSGLLKVDIELLSLRDSFAKEYLRQAVCLSEN